MGVLAFFLDIIVETLTHLRLGMTESLFHNSPFLGWLTLTCISVVFVAIAASLTVYVAPPAAGSGVAEAMGMLNGVLYPDYVSL